MKMQTYHVVSGLIFLLVAILHLVHIVRGGEAQIGGFIVPMWASWVAVVVGAFLAFTAFRLKGK